MTRPEAKRIGLKAATRMVKQPLDFDNSRYGIDDLIRILDEVDQLHPFVVDKIRRRHTHGPYRRVAIWSAWLAALLIGVGVLAYLFRK